MRCDPRPQVLGSVADSSLTETMAPSSALPVGAARVMSEMQPVPVNAGAPGSALINAVVAVLAPLSADENERYDEELLDLPVTSFVYMWVQFMLGSWSK